MSLAQWGWNSWFAAAFAAAGAEGKAGRVIADARGFCRVAAEDGEMLLPCGPSLSAAPVTGDWIVYDPAGPRVTDVLPRRTKISRKKSGNVVTEQVLAANVDVLFIVAGLDHDFNPRRLERYLLVARVGGAAPVFVLNKCDLCDEAAERAREVDAIAGSDAAVALVSALDRGSVMQLHRHVEPGQTAALVGSSGAGKSTIVNALAGASVQATTDVREDDSRGRHTTTARRLFRLAEGWLLIDTPGLRELEPWAQPEAAGEVFGDIEELGVACRFRDCSHDGEPQCAVAQAVVDGRLAPGRLDNYHKLRRELLRTERLQNTTAAVEERRRWKAIHRSIRHLHK